MVADRSACHGACFGAGGLLHRRRWRRRPDVDIDLRASTFHPPTLDLLDDTGLGQALIAQGLVVRNGRSGCIPRATGRCSISARSRRDAPSLSAAMRAMEIVPAALEALDPSPAPRSCSAPKSPASMQDDEGMTLDLGRRARRRCAPVSWSEPTVRVRWYAGARPWFEGETYPETTLLVTTTFRSSNSSKA